MLRRIKHCQIHYVGRAKNQEVDALANECLQEVIVGAVKLQEPKLQGRESLQDVLCFLERGEPTPHSTKGERRWLARKALRYQLIGKDLLCMGRTKYFGRFLPRRTFIESSIHVIMMFVVGTLPMSLPAGKFCRQGLCGHLCKGMRIFGAKCVMLVSAQGLDNSLMVPKNRLLLLGHLKNGALMPLGHCQGLLLVSSTS